MPQPVYHNPTTNKLERIWHPDGTPARPNPDAEATAEAYEGDGVLKEAYDYVLENGQFKDGVMPEIPPKREWVSFNL